MTQLEKQELVAHKMKRARDTYGELEYLISNNYLNTAINRLYYSCFYAVTALLTQNDILAKKHSGVKHMFGLNFIVSGIISKELGKFYSELFELRQDSDYEDFFEFEVEEIVVLLIPAKELIDKIEQILSV